MRRRKREVAPLLLSGETRLRNVHRLPPEIWEGIRIIAQHEGKSMSWVLEKVIVDFFDLKSPKYKKPQRGAR